jgi:hypothetical protein
MYQYTIICCDNDVDIYLGADSVCPTCATTFHAEDWETALFGSAYSREELDQLDQIDRAQSRD